MQALQGVPQRGLLLPQLPPGMQIDGALHLIPQQAQLRLRPEKLLTQATHIHMILVVRNPDHVSSFIRHFKTESAHMLNRILGRKKEENPLV